MLLWFVFQIVCDDYEMWCEWQCEGIEIVRWVGCYIGCKLDLVYYCWIIGLCDVGMSIV